MTIVAFIRKVRKFSQDIQTLQKTAVSIRVSDVHMWTVLCVIFLVAVCLRNGIRTKNEKVSKSSAAS